mmetsp:Transcript_21126/g.59451  ORF Transcript_21126/g.59451 Transcript_21126/m.59451 type:complete len:257 (-) Transcript_21126:482-1252(-)
MIPSRPRHCATLIWIGFHTGESVSLIYSVLQITVRDFPSSREITKNGSLFPMRPSMRATSVAEKCTSYPAGWTVGACMTEMMVQEEISKVPEFLYPKFPFFFGLMRGDLKPFIVRSRTCNSVTPIPSWVPSESQSKHSIIIFPVSPPHGSMGISSSSHVGLRFFFTTSVFAIGTRYFPTVLRIMRYGSLEPRPAPSLRSNLLARNRTLYAYAGALATTGFCLQEATCNSPATLVAFLNILAFLFGFMKSNRFVFAI